MSRAMLAACTRLPPLLDLARGTAASLNLDFREITSVEDVPGLPAVVPSIVIVSADSLSEGLLAHILYTSSRTQVWFILVAGNPSEGDRIRAMEVGAVACLSLNQAMGTLAYLTRNILRCAQGAPAPTPGRLRVSSDVILRVPEYILTDEDRETHIPPIPGRLLECLTLNPSALVSAADLKRSGWGTSDGVTDHALHEQMRHLREPLRSTASKED